MPMNRGRYPANWEQISTQVREAAGQKCQRCGVANGAEIVRSSVDGADYIVWDESFYGYTTADGTPIKMSEIPERYDLTRPHTRIVLTVHHKGVPREDGTPGDPEDKADCRPANLEALCQRCHLLADKPASVIKAKARRAAARRQTVIDGGQLELFK